MHSNGRHVKQGGAGTWKIGMKIMEEKKQKRAREPAMRHWTKVKTAIKNKNVLNKCSDDSYSAYIAE